MISIRTWSLPMSDDRSVSTPACQHAVLKHMLRRNKYPNEPRAVYVVTYCADCTYVLGEQRVGRGVQVAAQHKPA